MKQEHWIIGAIALLTSIAIFFGVKISNAEITTYPARNGRVSLIGKGGDSPWNQFEVYTFKHNQHRCFVVVKQDGNIDLDCP